MELELDKQKIKNSSSRLSINNWIKNFSWRLQFIVITIGLLIVATMSYGFIVGNYTLKKYTPLIDASMEIKLEITTAHLLLEEILNGSDDETTENVLKHIDEAQWYAMAMLNGGENFEGRYIALTNSVSRKEIKNVSEEIKIFRKITEQRLNATHKLDKSILMDHRYDSIFKDVIRQADKVENKLQAEIVSETQILNIIQVVVILFTFLAIAMIVWVFRCFDKRRSADIKLIHVTNEHLQKALDEVKKLQGIIPICGYCKKIRDEEGLWNQLEVYIHSHSAAEFSHGIFPDCYEKQMKELKNRKNNNT